MRRELANSGLTEEEILAKTMLLQKAMAGDNSPAFVNKTLRNALNAANVTPEELTKVKRVIGHHIHIVLDLEKIKLHFCLNSYILFHAVESNSI